ncbi:MAG: 3-phenylpropionate dioxygenase [Betaproteobacteria bacterium]|nr:3-phenylpropionate dioxygenase [Betaproteobacteria bacterium]
MAVTANKDRRSAGSPHQPAPSPAISWPRNDYSRVPYRLYHDQDIYRAEQQRIFKGPAWSCVGLEIEIANPGDYLTAWVGETPVIVNRDLDGAVHAMVNRCAHRGALVRREPRGNAAEHICIYHRWCFGLDGTLQGLPFRRGLKGKGGMSADFDPADHGLERLRVESCAGVIFASFSDAAEPLADYLGPVFRKHFERIFHKPIRVLGYQRHRIQGNWKLYLENQRDSYHGSLLHEFQSTFGLSRATQTGGVTMDRRHRHNLVWSKTGTDDDAEFTAIYKDNKVHESRLRLSEPSMVKFHDEFGDGISLAICGIFPNTSVHQIGNSLGTRQLRTLGVNEFEIYLTLFGYADDTPEMTQHRLVQANMVGPAGLISMEDGEAIEIVHRATEWERDACSVVEMGGTGPIGDLDFRVNDVPCRGFWSYYSELMGIEPEGAVR